MCTFDRSPGLQEIHTNGLGSIGACDVEQNAAHCLKSRKADDSMEQKNCILYRN